jgi:hypothetical protein
MTEPDAKKAKTTKTGEEAEEILEAAAAAGTTTTNTTNNDNGDQAVSVSASAETKKRLLSIWSVISEDLKTKVEAGDAAALTFFHETFPTSTHPCLGAIQLQEHCVYCHKNYDPRVPNTYESACRKEHDWGDGMCERCGYQSQATDEQEDDDDDQTHWEGQYCREGVCCHDIHDRINNEWKMYEFNDDLDDCEICKATAKEKAGYVGGEEGYYFDEEEEEEEDNSNRNTSSGSGSEQDDSDHEQDTNNKVASTAEIIVIDSD